MEATLTSGERGEFSVGLRGAVTEAKVVAAKNQDVTTLPRAALRTISYIKGLSVGPTQAHQTLARAACVGQEGVYGFAGAKGGGGWTLNMWPPRRLSA